jgi:nucleoid DNA-binding protein
MNHTQRIEETARRYRHLTRKLAKEAIETYLTLLAEDIASGDWVEIPGIGKLQVVKEKVAGRLNTITKDGNHIQHQVQVRLRAKLRLSSDLKRQCYHR